MDQTVTTQAWMRGNVGGLRDATRELGLRSPRCFIKQFGNNISQCFRWDPAAQTCISSSPLFLSSLHGLDSHRERDLLYSTLRHGCFRVKIQMSGSEHYPPLSNFYRRLAVQFCSSAELNPKKHSGKWGCRFSPVECAVVISASCLKVIRPRWGKDPNQACDAALQIRLFMNASCKVLFFEG